MAKLAALIILAALATAWETASQATQQQDQHLYSGISPSNTQWTQDSAGTISTTVAVPSHLQFASVPTYFSRVTYRGSGFASQFDTLADLNHLTNVTGASIPRSPTATSFKIRLEGRNITRTLATVSDFRVVWVAASPKYPPVRDKSAFEAHVALLKQYLIEEDPALVRVLLDGYQPMQRNIPKPVPPPPPPPPPKKNNGTSSSGKGEAKKKASSSDGGADDASGSSTPNEQQDDKKRKSE